MSEAEWRSRRASTGARPRQDSEPSQPSGLMDLLGVAATLLDADGRIVLRSPQAEELYGYTAEEALGSTPHRRSSVRRTGTG